MADKTTVLITQKAGPHVVPGVNYQAWTSAVRLTEGGEVTLPAPQPVRLDENGNGSVDVLPGVWFVDEIVPQNRAVRHAWLVPTSATPVLFADLIEYSGDLSQLGYGPVWAEQSRLNALLAIAAAGRADAAATEAEQWAEIAEDAAAVAAAPRYNMTTDGKSFTFEPSQYVTESADGKSLVISGGTISNGFRVPRLAANGDLLAEQIPLDDVTAYVLERIPAADVLAAVVTALASPDSPLRDALDALYAGAGSPDELAVFADTDGTPYFIPRSDL
jgi:hypothetical protein